MNLHVYSDPIESKEADWLVVGFFDDEAAPTPGGKLGEILGPKVAQLRKGQDFEGKPHELLALFEVDGIAAKRILLVGLGKPSQMTRRTVVHAASAAIRRIARKERGRVLFQLFGDGTSNFSEEERVTLIACGAVIGASGCDLYRTEPNVRPVEEVALCAAADKAADWGAAVTQGRILGQSVNLARELVNRTPAELNPQSFCDRATEVAADCGLDIEVLGPEKLAELGMNCILGVGQGSLSPPRLLVLRYHEGKADKTQTLCFVGKGITFDSGGLSLKTADGMSDMKCDMAGAATVLAATAAVARLKLPVNLLCVIPLAENMPSGSAIRPGDVLKAKNGKTIEVVNTDAEGRLVLADALCHAVDLGATHIVDLATLTGACVVALGMKVAGVMTNDKQWSEKVLAAAEHAGEPAWPLPMFDEYDDLIRSKVADMKNSGGRWGGAITAAKLLQKFVGDVPWTHVDIAGPSFAETENSATDAGGTGYFVRTLVELARSF